MSQPDAARGNSAAPESAREGGLVEAFANKVRELANRERRGDLAALRRLNAEAPAAPAFFQILVKIAPESGPDSLRRYARLLQIFALRPEALVPGSLGVALAAAGVSEGRVQKLLAARGPALAEQIRLIARRLANGGSLPYRQIGDLILAKDDTEIAEDLRLRIARDYWRALDRRAANES
jgi:CRISPR system Cascade subunit CasB